MSRVLVVNDSALEGKYVGDILSTVGHQVRAVKNAKSALDNMDSFQPHLIVTDVVLPDLSGIELAKKIKSQQEWRDIPLMFLSGSNCRSDRIEALRVGGVDFIAKPFDPEELLARLDVALRHKYLLDWFKSREESSRAEAMVDFLTNLPNRQYLAVKLAEEIKRANRYGSPFCVIMADVDNFKKVNDTYGHLAGDQVVIYVANLIRNQIRQSDMVFRFGGEEFCILTPETDLDGGIQLAQKLCDAMGSQEVQVKTHSESINLQTTISLGVAQYRIDMDTEDSLLELADDALYKAKRAGRNQVKYSG